jgi:hypothetical protein
VSLTVGGPLVQPLEGSMYRPEPCGAYGVTRGYEHAQTSGGLYHLMQLLMGANTTLGPWHRHSSAASSTGTMRLAP